MAWTVPSTHKIAETLRGALRRYLPGTDALVWPNNLTVIVKTVAAGLKDMHLRAAWLYDQIFASTAEAQHLDRHGAELGIYRRPMARAEGLVVLTGAVETIYPAGIRFVSGDRLYRSISDARSGPTGTVSMLVLSEGYGAVQNVSVGEALSRADPGLYIDLGTSAVAGTGGIGGGADAESDDDFRARILDRKRRPPQGGAYSDYEQFALAVPGVTHAWARPFAGGPGTVGVWFLFEGRTDGIPTVADVAVVRDALELRRMIRVGLAVNAPVPAPVAVTIGGLAPDTVQVRDAITASLRAMFDERAEVGVAAQPFTLSRSWIAEAVSQAVGEGRHVLVAPASDLTYAAGDIPVLGTVSYV